MMNKRHPASFRDPSGFIFWQDGTLYRQVNRSYQGAYDLLTSSGLYDRLLEKDLILAHEATSLEPSAPEDAYLIIKPAMLDFVSYPYEWSFSALKDAALTTLRIEKLALKYGMTLKDASAYNIQFHHGRPVLIDTLSFDVYEEGTPWIAYRQFCQHFLAPLALMAHVDVRFGQYTQVHLDGIPLDLASKLLPSKTKRNIDLYTHLHLHARSQQKAKESQLDGAAIKERRVSHTGRLGVVDSLKKAVQRLELKQSGDWQSYYSFHNYDDAAFVEKKQVVDRFLDELQPDRVLDLGANTALFSELASQRGISTVALDVDPTAVDVAYRHAREQDDRYLLPLRMDLTNPSPALGWAHTERSSLAERQKDQAVFSLALVHHLAIGNNVPLIEVARYFSSLGSALLIEFVPKADSQVKKMLASRLDIFPDYHEAGFEDAFSQFFEIRWRHELETSSRVLYAMTVR